MAIIDDLNNLQANILTAKQVLADNISSKGVSVSSKDTLTSLAYSVSKIEQGSGGSGQWILPDGISFASSSFYELPKELVNANTKGLTTMYDMFSANRNIQEIDLSSWDTSNVTNMYGMFRNDYSLTSIKFGDNFNTSLVTDMDSMFRNISVTTLDLSSFNTSKVTEMGNMFNNSSNLTSLDLSSFNTSQVSRMNMMFYGCSSLTELDLSNWDTSNVTTYGNMFLNCKSLSEIKMCNCSDSTIQFITDRLNDVGILSNVTIITECESNDKVNSLTCNFNKSTPITDLYFDMDNLPEEMGYYWVGFSYNPNQRGDCNDCYWDDGDLKICLFENRYEGVMNGQITELEQINGLYHLHLDTPLYFKCGEENSHLERYYLTPNKSSTSCGDTISFRWDGNATDSFEFELELRTRNVYREDCKDNGDGTYTYTTTLSDMGIETLTNCSWVFVHNHNLVELNNFPCTDNVTEMVNMFQSCNSLTSLDLSSFNVSNVYEMSNMFSSCSNLETLNLNGWKLNDMVDTDRMFFNCSNLREIYLKNSDETTYMKIQDAVIQSGINATIITK